MICDLLCNMQPLLHSSSKEICDVLQHRVPLQLKIAQLHLENTDVGNAQLHLENTDVGNAQLHPENTDVGNAQLHLENTDVGNAGRIAFVSHSESCRPVLLVAVHVDCFFRLACPHKLFLCFFKLSCISVTQVRYLAF